MYKRSAASRSILAGLLLYSVSSFPRPLFEGALQVDGGLLQHLLLDVGIDVGGGLVVGVTDDLAVLALFCASFSDLLGIDI